MQGPVLALALLAASQSEGPPPLLLVQEPKNEDACRLTEQLASVTALIPGLRVVRGPLDQKKKLAADFALGVQEGSLVLLDDQTTRVPADDLFDALRKIWPKALPALPPVDAKGAANDAALAAACRRDAEAAYAASGFAVGPVVRRMVDPPNAGRGVLQRWARAAATVRGGSARRALPVMKSVVSALAARRLGPTWRRAPPEGGPPSNLTLAGDAIVAFEEGTFIALDLTNGRELWRRKVGTAEPRLIEAGALLLAFTRHAVIALHPETGEVRWRVQLEAPAPETVTQGRRLFLAGTKEVIAVDPSKGEVLWRHDPLLEIAAGPVLSDHQLAVPASTFVLFLDPESGDEKKRVDAKDEISSPLVTTPQGGLWALVGSDEVVQIDPAKGEVSKRVTGFPGAVWPPAVAGERLVVAAGKGHRNLVAYLDPTTKSGIARILYGASSPLLSLPDYAGVVHPAERPHAIVARGLNGRTLWSARQRSSVTSLFANTGLVVGAAGTQVTFFDPTKGTAVDTFDLGTARVTEAVLGSSGGAAILDDGTIYGLPSPRDPRPTWWLEQARLDLARIYLSLNQKAPALATAKAVRDRNPRNLDALALIAGAERRPSEATAAWLAVARRAPVGDPLVGEAEAEMKRLAGIEARLWIGDPITSATAAGDRLLVLAGGKASARPLSNPDEIEWEKPAKRIGRAGTAFVVDGKLEGGPKIGADMQRLGPSIFVAKPSTLVRTDPAGKTVWKQSFDTPYTVLAADAVNVLVADKGARGAVQLLSQENGARRWMLPRDERVRAAWLGSKTGLLAHEKGYFGLSLENGKRRFLVPIDPADVRKVGVTERSFALVTDRRVFLVDQATGRLRRVPLPGTVDKVAIPAVGAIIASLTSGLLVAVDPIRGAITGRIRLGHFEQLVPTGARVLAVDEQGALLVIDPSRGLRP